MQTIRHLNIEITKNCNQRCLYCFNDSGPNPAMRSIAVSDWKRFLEGQIRHGLQSIHITGGEPFVDRNTLALLADAQRLGFGTSVLSNGFKIPELVTKYPQLFRELTIAQISLDTVDAARHDARRGKRGAWRDAILAIRALRRAAIPCEVSVSVSNENLADLPRIAKFCSTFGLGLIVRKLITRGRGQNKLVTPISNDCLDTVLEGIRSRLPGVLVGDRFLYVPTSPDHDEVARDQGVVTVLPNGKFRSGPTYFPHHQRNFESVSELLAA